MTHDTEPRWRVGRHQDCPDIHKHTAAPEGYLEWHAWAEEMAKTHRTKRCRTCGFWAIWVEKKKRGTPPAPPSPHGPDNSNSPSPSGT